MALVIWNEVATENNKDKTGQEKRTGAAKSLMGLDRPVPPPSTPSATWMFPAGIVAIILAILAFVASAAKDVSHVKPGTPEEFLFGGALLSGSLNPLFFIGLPLGLYWCIRGNRTSAGNAMRSQQDRPAAPHIEDNPRLTHCPDCGGHVSRLASSCPHCGRPLTHEKAT